MNSFAHDKNKCATKKEDKSDLCHCKQESNKTLHVPKKKEMKIGEVINRINRRKTPKSCHMRATEAVPSINQRKRLDLFDGKQPKQIQEKKLRKQNPSTKTPPCKRRPECSDLKTRTRRKNKEKYVEQTTRGRSRTDRRNPP